MAIRDHSETRLHIAVVHYLRGEIKNGNHIIRVQSPFPGLMWLHPSNEVSSKDDAYWNKLKGIMPGVADLLFWWKHEREPGNTHISNFLPSFGAIELKTNSAMRGNQQDFGIKFKAIGGNHAICKSVASVRDTLVSWGLKCKNEQAVEPKASQQEMQAGYFNMLRSDYDS